MTISMVTWTTDTIRETATMDRFLSVVLSASITSRQMKRAMDGATWARLPTKAAGNMHFRDTVAVVVTLAAATLAAITKRRLTA